MFKIKRDISQKTPIFHTPLYLHNLHDPLERLRIFAQHFNTNCPSPSVIRRCKNIAEKFKSLPRVQQRYTDRHMDGRLTNVTYE